MAASAFASTVRCSVLVCLRCGASHTETLPRGRAIDAQRGDQLGGGIWRLELEDGEEHLLREHLLRADVVTTAYFFAGFLQRCLGCGCHWQTVPQDGFERRPRRTFDRLVDRYRWCVERSADADCGVRIVIDRVERVAGCL
jgi:hypothetical protein